MTPRPQTHFQCIQSPENASGCYKFYLFLFINLTAKTNVFFSGFFLILFLLNFIPGLFQYPKHPLATALLLMVAVLPWFSKYVTYLFFPVKNP